ncbi:MAG: terminase [Actinobacteria bacterium]|nr:terminase [Actinomycetota bacterium]
MAMQPKSAKAIKEQQDRYLSAMRKTGTLTSGCRAAQCSPTTVYQWREHDLAFSMAENEAKNAFADALEEEAVRRAWHGVDKPVYQGKELVGMIREYSDTLLIFSLKALRPEKYRDRFDVRTQQDAPVVVPMRAEDVEVV